MPAHFPHITGLGLITPLGANCEENFQSLIAGKFITQNGPAKFPNGQGGNIHDLTLAAARQAMAQAGWENFPDNAAIIAGTSKGDVESWLATINDIQQHHRAHYPWQKRLGLGDLAGTLAEKINAQHCIRLTYSAACASALHALAKAVMMIRAGEISCALVVAAESSLHPLFTGSFQRLGVLAPAGEPCRPFNQHRHGFHISQAAAAICLEAPFPGKSQIPPIAQIDHVAIAADAWHLTGTDPEARTLRRLLQAAMKAGGPDLIHAHATGTESNDPAELSAIESVLNSTTPLPILYSHKAALGHSLGASGLISVVLNCLFHQHAQIPGNICTIHPLPVNKLILPLQPTTRQIHRSLALASGFGGAAGIVGLCSAK